MGSNAKSEADFAKHQSRGVLESRHLDYGLLVADVRNDAGNDPRSGIAADTAVGNAAGFDRAHRISVIAGYTGLVAAAAGTGSLIIRLLA